MQAALLVAAGLVVYNLLRPKTIQCKKKGNQPMESIWPLPQREVGASGREADGVEREADPKPDQVEQEPVP